MQNGDKWDFRFLSVAMLVSSWSKDPSTKVGAVIADSKNRIVSLGYNGFPRGVADHAFHYENKELKHEMVVHAEINAILNASADGIMEGCDLYSTFFPCPRCASVIIQAGLKRVVSVTNPADDRYANRHNISINMFRESGVGFMLYEKELLDRFNQGELAV